MDAYIDKTSVIRFLLGALLALVSRRLLSWLVGGIVLPAQIICPKSQTPPILKEKRDIIYRVNYFGIATPEGLILDTVEINPMLKAENNLHIIKFCANAMDYNDSMTELKYIADQNGATVVSFNYPNVGGSTAVFLHSQTQLVQAGIAQVKRILDKGIHPEFITLHGLSLGGAVATLVAAHFHTQPIPKPVCLINDRSFASISKVVSGMLRTSVLELPTNLILRLLQWDMNAAQAYKQIPENYKMIIVSKDDSVINYKFSSLYQAIKDELKQKYASNQQRYKQITHAYKIANGRDFGFVHCENLEYLHAKNGLTMPQNIKRFIANI